MTKPKRILYRGVPMIEGWPEKITGAQQIEFQLLEGETFLECVTAKNIATGALPLCPAMIARFLWASFMCRVAMSKSARYAAASSLRVFACSMTAPKMPDKHAHVKSGTKIDRAHV